jgi:shikimate dehydrogenase
MKRFGVIGHPIGHSLSPLLHMTAFSLTGLECTYEAFDIEPESLMNSLNEFALKGFSGLNVTIPHKERVATSMHELSEEAKAVGAVNTVLFEGGCIRGDNTDVYGVERSLTPYRTSIDGQGVLILGAGGTSRAIVYALLTRFRPSELVIANRNQSRADELVHHFLPYANTTSLGSSSADDATLSHLAGKARLIINATSIGMSPAIDVSPLGDDVRFNSDQVVFDLIYTPLTTRILARAKSDGARTISGLEMFLYQGARSFEMWLGKTMPIDRLREVIETELHKRQQTRF